MGDTRVWPHPDPFAGVSRTQAKRWLVAPRTVCVVWGPPASGKSTYVAERMVPGDLVIDVDLLKQAVSGLEKTAELGSELLGVALELRDALYRMVETGRARAERVWIITGVPQRWEREQLIARFGAEAVFMDVSLDECVRRAMADPQRVDKDLARRIIAEWFEKYRP